MNESPSRVERKRAKNRDALVAAARRLFTRDGFEATTVAAIAEAADLGFGTFYRYFPDKDAVLLAVLEIGRTEIDAVLQDATLDVLAPPEALRALTERFAAAIRRNHDLLLLVWQTGMRGEPNRAAATAEAARSLPVMLAAAVRRIIERGMASGDFASSSPELAADFLASAHLYLFSPTAHEIDETALVGALHEIEMKTLARPETAVRKTGRGSR